MSLCRWQICKLFAFAFDSTPHCGKKEHQPNEIFKLNSLESLFQCDCGKDKVKLKADILWVFLVRLLQILSLALYLSFPLRIHWVRFVTVMVVLSYFVCTVCPNNCSNSFGLWMEEKENSEFGRNLITYRHTLTCTMDYGIWTTLWMLSHTSSLCHFINSKWLNIAFRRKWFVYVCSQMAFL